MNILIISCVFPPEPVVSAKLSFDIATEMNKYNTVTVISPRPSRPHNFAFQNSINKFNFTHIILNSYTCPKSSFLGRVRESISFGIKCNTYIKTNLKNIDLIYQNSWPLFAQLLITKIAKAYRIPIITHIQDIYPESLVNKLRYLKPLIYSLLLPLDKYICNNSSKVICISENMKLAIETTRKVNPNKLYFVNNWIDENDFINKSHLNSHNDSLNNKNKFTFMYLGNIGPVAGVDFLINSFNNAKLENSQLIIAGSGSREKYCKDLVKSLEIDNIYFIPVPYGKVGEIQSMADAMILPVIKGAAMSSIPSKLMAYMFSSKPIIGCVDKNSYSAKVINDAKCGIVVEPENEAEQVNAFLNFSKIELQTLKKLGNNGYKYAKENFSKEKNLFKIVNLIIENDNSSKKNPTRIS